MTDPFSSEPRSRSEDLTAADAGAAGWGTADDADVEIVGSGQTSSSTYSAPVTTSSSYLSDTGSTSVSTGAGTGSGSSSGSGTTEAAKDQGKRVASDAKESGKQVAQVAKDEAASVAGEAKNQALGLFDQAKSQFSSQASDQKDNLSTWLSSLADELRSMTDPDADRSQMQSGFASNLAERGADYAHRTASWLGDHEPADILDEVGRFARRRPGAFLAIAAVAGVVVGRLTRGLTAAAKDESSGSGDYGRGYSTGYSTDYSTDYSTGYSAGTAGGYADGGTDVAYERRMVTPDVPVASTGPGTTSWSGGTGGLGDPDAADVGLYPEGGR